METIQPTIVVGIVKPTDVSTWPKDDIAKCNSNSRDVHAIFMAIFSEEFKRVFMYEIIKEAWDILEIIYEGIKIVKIFKLHMLTTI